MKRRRSGRGRTNRASKKADTRSIAMHPERTKDHALAAYKELGTVSAACTAARIGRRTWYDWLEADSDFANAVLDAHEYVADDLESEAYRRAKDGSDTLLIFLLKAKRPSKYRDRQTITLVSAEVQVALRQTLELIASRNSWDSQDLLDRLDGVWK